MNGLRICIIGHSGIGKSPLAKLFNVGGWEPKRVRTPRNEADKALCITKAEAETLQQQHGDVKPLYQSQGNPGELTVWHDWSRFLVRGKEQWLEHTLDAKNAEKALRIEIFGPVFVEMLSNLKRLGSAFALSRDDLMIILLNPTSDSFAKMNEPSPALQLAVSVATGERSRVQTGAVDLGDSILRIGHLSGEHGELAAWKALLSLKLDGKAVNVVECKSWPHFEFRYLAPSQGINDQRVELLRARETLLKAVHEQCPSHEDRLVRIVRTAAEILDLTEIA
jgi:hypothetical protein